MQAPFIKEEETLVSYSKTKLFGLIGGLALFLLLLILPAPESMAPNTQRALALGALMIVWWITDAVPMAITSLLPIGVLPMLGVDNIRQVAAPYANPAVFLTMGGLMLATAMQRWNLHLRLAYTITRIVGHSPDLLIASIMLTTGIVSLWVSNTATAVMMLPIGISVIHLLQTTFPPANEKEKKEMQRFAAALMLGIGYGASIGGMGSLIGTPTNAIFKGFLEETYGYDLTYAEWMKFALPYATVLLVVTWLLLTKVLLRSHGWHVQISRKAILEKVAHLEPISKPERILSIICILVMAFWIFGDSLKQYMPFLQLNDASVVMFAIVLIAVFPVNLREGKFLLSWQDAARIPWGVLLLIGGGLSLAATLHRTGFAEWVGYEMSGFEGLPTFTIVLMVCVILTFVTQTMSNLAVVTTMLPVVAALAAGFGENPILLMLPATLASSFAFTLPASTPPNAVVFGSGHLRTSQMAHAGLWLCVIANLLLLVFIYKFMIPMFDITPGQVPDWAITTEESGGLYFSE